MVQVLRGTTGLEDLILAAIVTAIVMILMLPWYDASVASTVKRFLGLNQDAPLPWYLLLVVVVVSVILVYILLHM